jgi:murein DD-endopeptidase MepM/ murein hydrolase activator NlpD
MQANGVSVPPGIHPGQRLVIPRYTQSTVPAPVASAPRSVVGQAESGTHTVVPGETMIGIAKRYNVALKDLAKANRVEPYAQLKMGDRLVIPGRAAAVAPSAKPPVLAAKPAVAPVPTTKIVAASPTKMAAAETTQSAHSVKPTQDVAVDDEPKGSASGTATFRWPVRGRIIAGFGPKPNGQQNDGINLSVPEGTPIKAAEDGVVAYSGNELKGYGNLVLIRHSNGFVTAYAHASELMVKRGDTIKRGQTIAKAGQTGTVTSPQVHFEIRKGSSPVDPTQYLNGA